MTKYLVTGSAGLIGHQVVKDLVQQGNTVYSGYNKAAPDDGIPVQMELLNYDQLKKTIEKTNPDAIIHLAAQTNVDLCETQKELATKMNADATKIIAKQTAKQGAFLVYVSTDYVFDGISGLKKETDKTNPVDYYGESKLQGENAVRDLASAWCIARTSTPYGMHKTKTSFPVWIAKNILEKKKINVVVDQFTSPTYVPNLSRMLIEVATKQITGIIHLAGATRISRYDMAVMVVDKLSLDKNFLAPTYMKDMKWAAKRPMDSSLDVSRAASILNEKPLTVNQGLDHFAKEYELMYK
jgi:dTDP-4-dehydrorhamnose reductase